MPLLAVSGCGGGDEGSGGGGSGGSDEPVKFGRLSGVTGDYAPWTKAQLEAANVAIEDIKAAGGVIDRQPELVVSDNKSTAEGTVAGFERLAEVERVHAVGGLESDGAVAILDSLAEYKLPGSCPQCGTASLDEAEQGGDWFWRFTASDTDLGVAGAQFARDSGYKRMSMLVLKTEGSISSAETFKQAYEAAGGEIMEDVRFDPGKSTYQAELQRAFDGDPDAVFMTSGFDVGIPLIKEWARRDYGSQFIMPPDMIAPEIAKASPELEGKAVAPTAAFDRKSPAWEPFATKYEERTGNEPTEALWEAGAYDEIIVQALAMEAAKSTDGEKVAEQMQKVANEPGEVCYTYEKCVQLVRDGKDVAYHGASGAIEFNENGNLEAPLLAKLVVKDGDWATEEQIELDPTLKEAVAAAE